MNNKPDKRILVIEDDKDIKDLLSQLFQSVGYIVDYVSNGQEALDLLQKSKDLPGLILLDLMMPVMDGYQFRQVQEAQARLTGIPVVIMTADGGVQSKAIKVGAKGFLKKPFSNIDMILQTIGSFFPDQGSSA